MKNELLIEFGRRIKKLRLSNEFSQEELAFRVGFHRTYIGMIERGERNPSLKNIKKFADVFGISLAQLFNENIDVKTMKEKI